MRIPLHIEVPAWESHHKVPVRLGVPLPRGAVFDPSHLSLVSDLGVGLPIQAVVLSTWPDLSVKWVLIDFIDTFAADQRVEYELVLNPPDANPVESNEKIKFSDSNTSIEIDTGKAVFHIPKSSDALLEAIGVEVHGSNESRHCRLSMVDIGDHALSPRLTLIDVEEKGLLRCTVNIQGRFESKNNRAFCLFSCRASFFAGTGLAMMDVQIHNPKAALHPGGIWDLGDPNSIFFKELSLTVDSSPTNNGKAILTVIDELSGSSPKDRRGETPRWESSFDLGVAEKYEKVRIYQDSSGGANWNSTNHVDRRNQLTVQHQGFQVVGLKNGNEKLLSKGRRAVPLVRHRGSDSWVAAGVEKFWQNFPTSISAGRDGLRIGIFPTECVAGYELQGGEKKRHRIWLEFGNKSEESCIPGLLFPANGYVDPQWIEQSGVVPYLSLPQKDGDITDEYVQNIIEGPHTFCEKREKIDEYGWRHFGDLYADHEAVNHKEHGFFASHYNNQYDFVLGALSHFLRSGDRRWWELMEDAVRHHIDIDIYHTDEDKAAYNHGFFWHTDHYKNAATCTHRTYSEKNGPRGKYGGGPSNEHNYTSGLLFYYYLTGDREARQAVLELANWVLSMDDGNQTILGLIDEGPTGGASSTVSTSYHKPGRGAGNSINALLDAYQLTGDRRFMAKAESLIQRCIHPLDDIDELQLDEPEYRWSYLVFLQVIGKYLSVKEELGEIDYAFFYARDSLLHYADWMMENEVPYKDVLHKVLIPTETWPAHDIRKCHIFHLAEKHGPEEKRGDFRRRAEFLYDRCLKDLLSFDTAYLTRPLVILAVYGHVHNYFEKYRDDFKRYRTHGYNFGQPKLFLPQKARIKEALTRKIRLAADTVVRFSAARWWMLKRQIKR